MDGLPVEYGETISRTGVMLVRVDASYELSQNGIQWESIGTIDGADEFVVGSNGRISISVGNREVFFFTVEKQMDFSLRATICNQLDSQSSVIENKSANGIYVQTEFVQGVSRLRVYCSSSDMSVDDLMSLGCSFNQDGVSASPLPISTHASWILSGFDSAQHLEIYCGNVLICFLTPLS